MSQFKNFLSLTALRKIAVIFLAGFLLFVTTACNPNSPRVSGEGSYRSDNRSQLSREYGTPSPDARGGMNLYEDTVQDTSAADARARRLVRNAQSNINRANNPREFAEEYREGRSLGDRIENVVERVTNAADDTASDVSAGAQRGARNVRRNTEEALDTVGDAASDRARDVSRGVQRAAEDASDKARDVARDTAKATQRTVEDTAARARERI